MRGAIVSAVTAGFLLTGSTADERIVAGDGLIAGTVNGVSARIRVDPGAAAFPIFNPEFAQHAGLRGTPMDRPFTVGPMSLTGTAAVAEIVLQQARLKRRIAWYERAYSDLADGTLGPTALPEKRVRFQLRPPGAKEQISVLPMESSKFGAAYGRLIVGNSVLLVRFSPSTPNSLVTAGAASVLARSNGAKLTGLVSDAEIAFGVRRPVRTLILAEPLRLGALTLRRLQARLYDFGSTAAVPEAEDDPDEIVVTAPGKATKVRLAIVLGADALKSCSAIVFDRAATRIELSCSDDSSPSN